MRVSAVICLLLLMAGTGGLMGQAAAVPAVPAPIVRQIEVLKTVRTNPEMVRRRMRTKEGEPLNLQELVQDLHRIFEMGYFADIKRQLDYRVDGVYITIVVEERRFVAAVLFEGNTKFDAPTLAETVKTKAGGFLFDYFVEKRDLELIRERYIEKSYFNVAVESRVDDAAEGVRVTYRITENTPARIKAVAFSGNTGIPEYELKRVMRTDFFGWWPDRIYRRKIFADDVERIGRYYRSRGYLESKVAYRVVFAPAGQVPGLNEVMAKPDLEQRYGSGDIQIHIFVAVTEGPRYKIGPVAVSGNREEVLPVSRIRAAIRLAPGADYSQEEIERDMQRIKKLYGDMGYAFARIVPEERYDLEQRTAAITYQITEGTLFFVQDIEVIGNTRTKAQVVMREVGIAKGERFNYSKVLAAQMALNRIGLFRRVDISTRPGSGADLVVIVIEVEEDNTGAFEVMLSYDERNKIAGTLKLMQKNFDVLGMFTGHFMGAAHELSLDYMGSPVTKQLSFSFTNPRIFDGRNTFTYRVAEGQERYTLYDTEYFNNSLSVGREFYPGLRAGIGLGIKDIDLYNLDAGAPVTIQAEEGMTRIRSIQLNAAFDRQQYFVPFFPAAGYTLGMGVEMGGDFLNANREFIDVTGSAAWYHTLGERSDGARQVLSISARGKIANEMGDDTAVPLSERSWLGGIGSVRGFAWGSIGPYIGDTNVKGDAFGQVRIEYMYPLKWDPVYRKNLVHWVLYYDAGLVWNEGGDAIDALREFDATGVRSSVGMGLRLFPGGMPIPIEFYWSLPFAEKGDDTRRFQVGIFGMPF
ncbi:MAG: outer membrane protein assembly factor BamA [Planctomycetota bacterium]